MKPVYLKNTNRHYRKWCNNQNILPAYKNQGHVHTEWKMSFKERMKLIFGKNVCLDMEPAQPVPYIVMSVK